MRQSSRFSTVAYQRSLHTFTAIPMLVACVMLLMLADDAHAEQDANPAVSASNQHVKIVASDSDLGLQRIEMRDKPLLATRISTQGVLLHEYFGDRQPSDTLPDYDVTVNSTDNSITLQTMLTEKNAGLDLDGCIMRKTFDLPENAPQINVTLEFRNEIDIDAYLAYGVVSRNHLTPGDRPEASYWPTVRNILKINNFVNDFYTASAYDFEPVEGWLAQVDPDTGAALIAVFPLETLQYFFAQYQHMRWAWGHDVGIIKPGETRKTHYTIFPRMGFAGVTHANSRFIADAQIKNNDGTFQVTHTLAAGAKPLEKLTLKTVAYGIRTGVKKSLPNVTIEQLGHDATQFTINSDYPMSEPIRLVMTLEGDGWSQQYENVIEGDYRSTTEPGYPYVPEYERPRPE